MKRFCALLLAMTMCFCFAACGNNAEAEPIATQLETVPATEEIATEEPTVAETIPEGPAEDEVCCVLSVSINPLFDLQLNKDGLVLRVEYGNDDAKNALGSVDVTKMSGDAAIEVLLETIYQYDSTIFEKEMAKVDITVDMRNNQPALEQTIFRIDDKVMEFADKHQIPLGYQRKSLPTKEEMMTVISDTVDANGNRVVVEMDGNGVKWETVSSGETGQVLELTKTAPDGTVTYSDMVTGTTTTTRPDGTTSQEQGVIGKG